MLKGCGNALQVRGSEFTHVLMLQHLGNMGYSGLGVRPNFSQGINGVHAYILILQRLNDMGYSGPCIRSDLSQYIESEVSQSGSFTLVLRNIHKVKLTMDRLSTTSPNGPDGRDAEDIGRKRAVDRIDNIVKPNTQGSPVDVEMPGSLGKERRVGGWPNLVEIANMALKHFDEICDPNYHYVPYIGGTLGWRTPAFNHHRFDWIEVLPYPIIARIIARRLTGSMKGKEVEIRQRQLLLSSFHNLDGFAYPHFVKAWGGGTELDLWEQGRVLYALLAWFEDSGDERLLSYARGMVQGLMSISYQEDGHRYINDEYATGGGFGALSPVSMVESLTKYHEVTNDSDAIQLCDGMVRRILDPKTQFTDSQYRLSGFLRGNVAVIASIARFAAHTNNEELLDEAERLFRSAHGLISSSGATPCEEPCCTLMEMTTAALALTKAGRSHWWDMVDRYFRNQSIACQFRDSASVNIESVPGEPQPFDDTRDVINRSVGGFTWASPYEHLYWDRRLMLCCGGHAIWNLGKIVGHAVTEDANGLSVHLHFSLDTPLASVTSHEPFEGLLEILPNKNGDVKVRNPSYAIAAEAKVNGAESQPVMEGDYLVFRKIRAGTRIELRYPMPERTTEEIVMLPQQASGGVGSWLGPKSDPIVGYRTRTEWRGNTVLAIDHAGAKSHSSQQRIAGWTPQPKHRLYLNRMQRYKNGTGRDDKAAFFLPERPFAW